MQSFPSDFGLKGPFAIGRAKSANTVQPGAKEEGEANNVQLFEKAATVGQYPEKLKEFGTNSEKAE